jgi:putative phage-type endonuclease
VTDQTTLPPATELLPPGTGPHDERWHELRRTGVTASEIAAVMGLSPWASAFSLYWQKVNGWGGGDSSEMTAGRYVESSAADWWIAENDPLENLILRPAGLYAHPERRWQLATPDRLIHMVCACCDGAAAGSDCLPGYGCECCRNTGLDGPEHALLECKFVAYSWDGWGEPGTDDIPVYYRAQALWQLDVLGVDEVHFAALGPGGFRAYGPIRRDEKDLRVMRAAGATFHARLESGEAPDLDGHSATLTTLSRLHPSAGEGDVQVPVELAETYRRARALRKRAEAVVDRCEARIRDALGSDFNRAVVGKKLVASRSVYERRSDDEHELHALDDGYPITDRLNPGRASSYA